MTTYFKIIVRLLVLISCAGKEVFAQEPDFLPLKTSFADSAAIIRAARKHNDERQSSLRKEKELAGLYQQRHDRFVQNLREGNFVNEPLLNDFFGGMLQRIFKSNPSLPAVEARLYVSRDSWPNAAYIGDGNMVFNLGLLRRLETEAQAAFVLCHELAHWSLDHPGKAMEKYLERLHSKETQARIKEIQRMEYGARKGALALVQDLVFDSRRHSRTNESQADSLGLVFMRNAGYDLREAIACMAILDASDEPKFKRELDFGNFFPHPDYPFKPSWLPTGPTFKYSDSSSEFDEDSLKTHPGCARRIERMAAILENEPQEKVTAPAMGPEKFRQLVTVADFDQVARLYDVDALGRCLHAADQMMVAYPGRAWLHGTIAVCFYRLYRARESHTMGRYVERPSPRHDEDYGKLVKVLNEMRMSELARAGYYFAAFHLPKYRKDERFLAVYLLLAAATDHEDTAALAEYEAAFPAGTWLEILENY